MDEITKIDNPIDTSADRNHRSEEALAAIAVLCVYELLDAPGPEWIAHMSALPLLGTAPAQILDTLSPQPPPRELSKRSIFWNFVRQDYLYAFIHETRTRLNPDDPQFWRESGLLVGENGFLEPHCATDAGNYTCLTTDEDLVSHCLFWILGKIANFIVALVELDPDESNEPNASSGKLSHDEITSEWLHNSSKSKRDANIGTKC
ncbi:hypothetical protein W97_07558 [Coniosporium apollinis CBS 100218]|uniref:Uncharacterized protein n=1 Tax=Coniosporium apollinis (strain CBS 100218) TaxID=1168221 RepID=R7Z274_CONA1|nr:uncharacterized protein W97_07558 [Coniosporium apollinis CBS 100218]EON68300.1 hypothetical protein W97_07558 [Coniosporium apollinis CBS 100218]